MTLHGNLAPYNVGPVLWFYDLAVPRYSAVLLWRRHLLQTRAETRQPGNNILAGETSHDRQSEREAETAFGISLVELLR